jgi:polysaccharide pyruvyl transferase WcaK-like protein
VDRQQVNVVGWYGKANAGDESYRRAFPKLFPDWFFAFSDSPRRASNAYVLGGGDVVNSESLKKLRNAPGGNKHLMSVTVSSDVKAEELEGVRSVIVRDRESAERLMASSGVAATVAPDFAFALQPDRMAGKRLIKSAFEADRHDLYEKVVVVATNSNVMRTEDGRQARAWEKLADDLAYVMDWTKASFLFVPFGTKAPWDDRASNGYVASRPKWFKKNVVVWDRWNATDVLNVIGAADAVISMRLHSSIFSVAAGVPFIDIVHNHKNRAFLAEVALRDWSVPLNSFDADWCKDMLQKFIGDDFYAKVVAAVGNIQRNRLMQVTSDVCFIQ